MISFLQVPDQYGTIRAVAEGKGEQILVGTSRNFILRGTFNDGFQVEVQVYQIFYLMCSLILLKIKVTKGGFAEMPWKNHFWFPKEAFSEQILKEPQSEGYFNDLKSLLFHYKGPSVGWMDSMSVKYSPWNAISVIKNLYF